MDNMLELDIDYSEKIEDMILWVIKADDVEKDSFACVVDNGPSFFAIDYTKKSDYIELLDIYEISSDEYLDFMNANKYIVDNFTE